jgi:hypothetical protein
LTRPQLLCAHLGNEAEPRQRTLASQIGSNLPRHQRTICQADQRRDRGYHENDSHDDVEHGSLLIRMFNLCSSILFPKCSNESSGQCAQRRKYFLRGKIGLDLSRRSG